MKKTLFIIASVMVLLSLCRHGYAGNKKIYYDSYWRPVTDESEASFVRTIDSFKHDHYFITDRYKKNVIQMTGSYFDLTDENSRDGYFTYYDTSGKLFSRGLYKNNEEDSTWVYYYPKYSIVDFKFRLVDYKNVDSFSINFKDTFNISDNINIDSSDFYNFLGVSNTKILDSFNVSNSIFSSPALFYYNIFDGPANFSNDSFASLNLTSCIFYHGFTFTDNYINSDLLLTSAVFKKNIVFNNVVFGNNAKVDFRNALLPDTLDFSSNARVNNQVDLLVADFSDTARYDTAQKIYKKPHYINLYKSDISKFHLDYFHFRLYFPPDLTLDERNSVYEALLNNFKIRGQDDSYEKLDIEYRAYKYLHTPNRHWLNYVDKWWWNYGYDKDLVFVHAAFFLLFFTFITFIILGFLNDEVYSMDDIKYTIPLSMQKYRNAEPEESKANSADYTLAANNKLSALYTEGGLDIKIKPVARNSVYTEQYKTIIYCLFLGGFTIFLFSYYGLERFVLKKHVVASLLHHRYTKLKWGAGITAILLMLWIIRNKLYQYKPVVFFDSVLTRFWLSLVYTSKLFFPLFIKIENLKYKHQLLVFYILFVYLVGILCVGYMTNFVFQK